MILNHVLRYDYEVCEKLWLSWKMHRMVEGAMMVRWCNDKRRRRVLQATGMRTNVV